MISLLVSGYREWPSKEIVWFELDWYREHVDLGLIVHGDCQHPDSKGYSVDQLAKEWAIFNELPYLSWPAQWRTLNSKRAGPWRNTKMIVWAQTFFPHSTIAVAFIHPRSRGTLDFAKKIFSSRIPLKLVNPQGQTLFVSDDSILQLSDERLLAFASGSVD